ncbi:MAG: alpha/beta hydrolase [Aestuariivirga sp.]
MAWGTLGEGPPIVLIHGTPFNAQVWHRIAPWLAQTRKVYFYDLLGYGKSAMFDGQDVSLAMQNRVFVALLRHWALDQPEVVAHDFGGATVLRALYLNGLRYKRLTLIDPVALAPWGSPFVQHVRQYEDAFAGLPPYAHEALLNAYLQGASWRGLSLDALKLYAKPWLTEKGQRAFYRQIAQMDQKHTDDVQPLYAPPDFPTQILWGENDRWIPIDTGRKLAAILTNGRMINVPNCGHLMQEDAPEAILAAVLGFTRS